MLDPVSAYLAARRREPLSRSGLALSLVILRGAFTNLLASVGDTTPDAVATAVYRLRDLRDGRVREVVERSDDDHPHEAFLLRAYLAGVTAEWPAAAPSEREAGLFRLIHLVTGWIDAVEAKP